MASTTARKGQQSSDQTQPSDQERHEQVARRAYELYLERGEQSDALQNWLDAEIEITASGSPASSSSGEADAGGPKR